MIKISPFTPLFFSPSTDVFGAESKYVQIFAPADNIFIEVFSTALDEVEGAIVNQVTKASTPIEFNKIVLEDGVFVYYATVKGLPNGYYTAIISGKESEMFKITDNERELEETTLIKYTMRSNKQRRDCVFWNGEEQFFFEFRAPGGFKDDDWAFSVNNEQFEISNGNIVELFAIESTQKKFTLGNSIGCPVWYAEHLNRILCCSNVTFNGTRFVRKGNSVPEMTQEVVAKKSYIFKVSLQGMVDNVDVELPSGEESGGSEGGAGGEGYIYLIKLNDETIPTDRNTFSSLRILFEIEQAIKKNNEKIDDSYLSKIKPDSTAYLLKLLGGAQFGEFTEPLATRTGAAIDADGNGMFSTLSAKQMRILTLIMNKLTALAGDFVMTDSGEIEHVELVSENTYRLSMVRKHDNDITDLEVDDVLRASLEDLTVNNKSYVGWYRVLAKNTQDNTLTVAMYAPAECEGNVNYPPVENMIVHRWGNATNKERQRCWYISSPEGRIVYLTGVYKPKLETSNYASFYGLPVMLDFLKDKGINPDEPYLWVRGLIAQDIIRVDYQGNVEADIVDRGLYDPAVAKGPDPYLCRAKRSTNGRFETHDVWANSCRYRCLKSGTHEVPKWNAVDWVQISGDTTLHIELEKPNGDAFVEVIDCPIVVHIFRGVEEITEDVSEEDIAWSRDTGDPAADLAWPSQHLGEKKRIRLRDVDCPKEVNRFTVTAFVRDGEEVYEVKAIETIDN